MIVTELRILRWMRSKTRNDRIRNANIYNMERVAPIDDKLRENKLKWFGYICCRLTDAIVKKN